MNSIFDETGNEALYDYLRLCSKHVKLDVNEAHKLAVNALKYYRGNKIIKEELRVFQDLEKQWYDSIRIGKPDFDSYNHVAFLSDVWACWIIYSRKYLLAMKNNELINGKKIIDDICGIESVVDLGCGFGYTTSGLKELFPKAEVFGTNFVDSCQFKVASAIGKERGFKVVPTIHALPCKEVDLIFASEYFEHFERPIEHLLDIIETCDPLYFIIANSFNSISHGHFLTYKHGLKIYDGKAISREFNETLRKKGYSKVKTNCWNDRPTYWKWK